MVLSEAEGLLRIAVADLETAVASSDPAIFREGAWGFSGCSSLLKKPSRPGWCISARSLRQPMTSTACCAYWNATRC